jgi:hypothetical protein
MIALFACWWLKQNNNGGANANNKNSWPKSLIISDYGRIQYYESLAGNVADMSATCWPDSQMLALLADTALSCRHKTDPDTAFLCQGWPTFTPFFF